LVFTDDAIEAAATKSLELKTGARGLRTIIEEVLLDVMFDIPSRGDVKKCIITAETILEHKSPIMLTMMGHTLEGGGLESASA